MVYFIAFFLMYAAVGVWFVVVTNSRGFVADALFAALWPVYWYMDWRDGRL